MRKLAQPIILLCLSLAIPASLLADRAHDLAKVATKQKAVTGCNPGSLTTQSCHAQFPTGCTDSRSKYDAYLNFLKNQTPGVSMASTAELGDTDFKTLESKVPSGTTSKNHAKLAPTLANLGEGNIVTVIAYLYFVEDTGKGSGGNPSVGETTNCSRRNHSRFSASPRRWTRPAWWPRWLRTPAAQNGHLSE